MKCLVSIFAILIFIYSNVILQAQWVQTSGTGTGKVKSLAVNASYIFAGTSPGGVYRSTNDGTDWTQVNNGLSFTDINALYINGTDIYNATTVSVYRSANNGTNWSGVSMGVGGWTYYTFASNGSNIFAGGIEGINISTNSGSSWSLVDPQNIYGSVDTGSVYSIALSGNNVYAGTIGSDGGGIYLSTNNGTNWSRCFSGKYIQALTVIGTKIFAGTWGSGVYISTNNGTNWTQVNSGLTSTYVYSFAVNGSSLFAGTNSGIFLSNDNGAGWTPVGLDNNYILSLAISGTNLFAGTSAAGVWRRPLSELTLPVELSSFMANVQGRNILLNWSTQTEKNSNKFIIERKTSGFNWESIGSVNASVLSNSPRHYSFADNNLQSGKYQYRLKMVDNDGTFDYSKIIETEVASPKIFELSQNYPNPFNPSTKISYTLPLDSRVTIEVYNIAGERIHRLVNEEQAAGFYSIDFNPSSIDRSISSGVYFYRIIAFNKIDGTNFSSIKKMILLK
ncbi:MAG: T9SS type A sorting domain-containing protein [Ignavibacteriaceae bacterium]|nr:T9SS type A sorting domain-containing protein [Ignavibacteriaceae bacterium]